MRTIAGTAAAVAACGLVVAGCSGGGGPGGGGPGNAADGAPAKLTITPANNAKKIAPDKPVRVSVAHGKVGQVKVTDDDGHAVTGKAGAGGTTWATTDRLAPSKTYTVTATATGENNKQVSQKVTFSTLKPSKGLNDGISPTKGETVGIGMPIQLILNQEISKKSTRQEIERSLEVRTSTPIVGAWHWVNGNTEVDFRPKDYWPTGTKVQVNAHLTGLHLADGVWAARDVTSHFTIGPKHISTVKNASHEMTVKSGGKTVRTIPVSMGKPGDDTYSGTTIAQEKAAHIIMDSATTGHPGEYRIPTSWNVRLTYSGTFVHAAPWSVGAQGSTNVSHGCVNVSPSNAEWFFHFTNQGDIIKVEGTSRRLQFGNGPTPWVMDWSDWKKGSALGKSVTTGKL